MAYPNPRAPLWWLAARTGSSEFHALGEARDVDAVTESGEVVELISRGDGAPVPWDNPSMGTGRYILDQSSHMLFLLVAALIMAKV